LQELRVGRRRDVVDDAREARAVRRVERIVHWRIQYGV
jgi:hypothetical protein